MSDSPQVVLLIGFERALAERMTAFLAQAGHRTYPAGDVREATETLNGVPIGLALADLEGPFKEVLGAIEVLCASGRPRCPILGVGSVQAGAAMIDALRTLGLVGLVAPNVSPQELIFRVNALLYSDRDATARGSPRVPVDLPGALDGPHGRLEGRVLNLSETGLFLAVEHAVAPNETVTVTFALHAGAEPIAATCRVAWTNRRQGQLRYFQGMGLRFLGVSPRARHEIKAYLDLALADLALRAAI